MTVFEIDRGAVRRLTHSFRSYAMALDYAERWIPDASQYDQRYAIRICDGGTTLWERWGTATTPHPAQRTTDR